jgi:hypothetical protein
VGGRYLEKFMKFLRSVYSPTFKNSPNSDRKKMLVLLKTWYIYYPGEILNTIYNELGLATYEAQLLLPEDHKKIEAFIKNMKEERRKKKGMPGGAPLAPHNPVQQNMP